MHIVLAGIKKAQIMIIYICYTVTMLIVDWENNGCIRCSADPKFSLANSYVSHFAKEIMAVVSLDDVPRRLFPQNIVEVEEILPRVEKICSDSTTFFSRNAVLSTCQLCLCVALERDRRHRDCRATQRGYIYVMEIESWHRVHYRSRTEKLLPKSLPK